MELRGKKVTVVGMGRTSLALVRLLLREGAFPFVTDSGDSESLEALRGELDALGVPYECGQHTETAFDGASLVVPSPGVSPSIPSIQRARSAECIVLGEIELASRFCRAKIVAVTGTNGKTTTTELIRALIANTNTSVVLAGNNATPLSEAVMVSSQPEIVVLEMSSYQLETATGFRPWIGAMLNVSPDHLARHKTLHEYAHVKAKLFANQRKGDHAVLNADDPLVREVTPPDGVSRWWFTLNEAAPFSIREGDHLLRVSGTQWILDDEAIAGLDDTPLPGRHNLQNVAAALCVAKAAALDWDAVLHALRVFKGVEHRIEYVTTIGEVAYYNDSKSTNLDSLRVALESFEPASESSPGSIVLIAGGRGKDSEYSTLTDIVRARVTALCVFGEDAAALEASFGEVVPVTRCNDLAVAVRAAADVARPGDIVLFSPACASFDQFRDFEHRGRVFKELVAGLGENSPVSDKSNQECAT
ncbi:MAG: UDP-N-acetylmuramoyl-L-alanine--D-glutamate ligase [Candidatus Hydrogenedentes bacterium]|nr:UDP-N-acetylmuramoyl-L-alanine--D-glutamate ligase [Candidatus Hydrogenedentota bacterium]